MKKYTLILGAAIAIALALPANAQWSDNFDSYAAGSQVIGQGGWTGWDNDPLPGGIVSSLYSASTPHSVRIAGTSYDPGAYSDLVHTFSGYTSGIWRFSANQFIPNDSATGKSYFILMNQYTAGNPTKDWAIQTTFDLAAGTLTEEMGASSPLNIVKGQWATLWYDINLDLNTVSAYYNGTLFSTHVWNDGTVQQIQAVDLYSDISAPVYYDNLSLQVIPEPATGALCLLAIGALLLRRR